MCNIVFSERNIVNILQALPPRTRTFWSLSYKILLCFVIQLLSVPHCVRGYHKMYYCKTRVHVEFSRCRWKVNGKKCSKWKRWRQSTVIVLFKLSFGFFFSNLSFLFFDALHLFYVLCSVTNCVYNPMMSFEFEPGFVCIPSVRVQ